MWKESSRSYGALEVVSRLTTRFYAGARPSGSAGSITWTERSLKLTLRSGTRNVLGIIKYRRLDRRAFPVV